MQILTPETIYFHAFAVLERLPARAKTAASYRPLSIEFRTNVARAGA